MTAGAAGAGIAYAAASLLAFAAYGIDKRRAVRGDRRVAERTLHLLELLGGWPGAYVAAAFFHHKTQKLSFRIVRFAIALLHVAGWTAAWRAGWLVA